MKINEIAECCYAINHLRKLIAGRSIDDSEFMEFSSDLLLTYQELYDYMEEEMKFLKSAKIK